jgi:RimJ/RimL family protein N-acetyltransferase
MLPIRTPRLEIRDFVASDFEAVHRYASDPVVTRYLAWGPNTDEETREFLERAAANAVERPRQRFELAVVDVTERDVVGGCGLFPRDEDPLAIEIGYCLRRDVWRRGVGSETVRTILPLAFEGLHARRVHARVDPENGASGRLLERVGFSFVTRFQRDTFIRGEWRDSLLYTLHADAWTARNR